MEVVAPKKNLLRLLQRCQGVADKKSTMPVLANVLLSAQDNRLELAATDLYLSVTGALEAEVTRNGSVAVPARDMYDRVKYMPDGPVQISVAENAATTIKATGSARRYTLHGLPGGDFPALPNLDDEAAAMDIKVTTLKALFDCTYFSISTDETRAYLNSALFECADDVVRVVTTDGHRLTKAEIALEGVDASTTMLIPLKAVAELRKLFDEAHEDRGNSVVRISQTGPNAFFEISGVRFSVKLIDGQFPPYEAVIPAMTDRAVRAARKPLSEALNAVALAASNRTGGVKIGVAANMLHITSESPESGNGFDELPVDYEGPELSVGFNARYLVDVLNAIDDEEVTLGLSGELDPAVVKPAGEAPALDYVAVVMPMRI